MKTFIMKRIVVFLSAMFFVAIALSGCELPIVAINNSMLGLMADSGSGTAADPYIIENKPPLDMAGKDIYHSGIHLMYTNAHLIIRNITIKNGAIASSENKAAILLQGVSNVTVESCTFENNKIGIMLENSSAVRVFDNDVVNNRSLGIYLKGSSLCVVKDNRVSSDTGAVSILLDYNPFSDIWIKPSVCQYNQILDNETSNVSLYGNGTTSYNKILGNSLGGVPATVIESPGAGVNNIY